MGKHILITQGLLGKTYHLFDEDGREIALSEDAALALAKEVIETAKAIKAERDDIRETDRKINRKF